MSLGLAFLLAFCTLSAGMVVHAEEEELTAKDVFASVTVAGESVDLEQCPYWYCLLDYGKTSAEVAWTLNEGWTATRTYYTRSGSTEQGELENGKEVQVTRDGNAYMYVVAEKGSESFNFDILIYYGKGKLKDATLWVGSNDMGPIAQGFSSFYSRLVSIKSSDPDILSVKKGPNLFNCTFKAKKAGKCKVTVVVDINGVEHSFSGNYTVKKYPKAITSLKVAGKKVDLKKNRFSATVKVKKDKTKVEYKIAKGWKVKSCTFYDQNTAMTKKLKSGKNVPTKNNNYVSFELTKGSDTFTYYIALNRAK